MEKSSPPVEPTAKEYQKGESFPSMKNGTRPRMVERTVRNTAVIWWLYALIYVLSGVTEG